MKRVMILSLMSLFSGSVMAQGVLQSQSYLDVPGPCQNEAQRSAVDYAHGFPKSDTVSVVKSEVVSALSGESQLVFAVQVNVCDEYDRCALEDFKVVARKNSDVCEASATYLRKDEDER